LTPDRWEVKIIDEHLRPEDGRAFGPDLVGITALSPNAPRAYELAAQHRAAGAKVVLGGVHASTVPDEAARFADVVHVGEAEGTWPGLIRDFERGALKERYVGEFLPLDRLPVPRRDLYRKGYFLDTIGTSRGCPYSCPFCSIWRFYERGYRVRPVGEVV